MLKFQITTTALLLGAILLIANSNLYEYASAQTVSKKTETMCQAIYKSYKQLGKSEFLKKFSGTAYINDCLKLYDNPSWTFKGKDDVDKFYSKAKKTDDSSKQSTKGTVKLLSKSKIGDSKYVSKVSVCSAKEGIRKPVILIQSDKEKFVGVTSITVPPQQCRDFFTQISSNNPDTIKSTLLEGMEIPKGITVKQMK